MIVASCIKFKLSGYDYWQYFTGKRHADIYEQISHLNINKNEVVEGFMTDNDQFVDRHEATFIAKRNGQVPSYFDDFYLYSEDMWPEDE